jgi:hypothetical protein
LGNRAADSECVSEARGGHAATSISRKEIIK